MSRAKMTGNMHERALVHPEADLGRNVRIGPDAIVNAIRVGSEMVEVDMVGHLAAAATPVD